MLRLVLADLLQHARVWLGVTVVAAAAALVLSTAAADLETAARTGGDVGLALYAIGGLVVVTTTVAAVVVLASAADLTVVLQQRSHALWLLLGISPAAVRRVVRAQLLLAGLVGALVGTALAVPLLSPLFARTVGAAPGFGAVEVRYGGVGAAAVVVAVVVVVGLSGGRSARRASRVAATAVLRDPDPPGTRVGAGRWVLAVVLLGVLVAVLASLGGRPADRLQPPLLLTGLLVAGVLVALGPLVVPAVLRAWTRLVPVRLSSAWFLARASAAHRTGRSAAAISPLLVACALTGSLSAAGAVATAGPAAAGTVSPVSLPTVVLLVGGPVLLSVLGAVVTVLMSAGPRHREAALVRAAGGTPGLVLLAALAEAVIYVVTAALLGLVAVAVTTAAGLAAVGAPLLGPATGPGFRAAGVTAAAELVVLAAATLVPAALGARRSVRAVLAAE